ncbi:MAG TPA: ABC transporter permease, partial [Burkholderiaceae bacterium]|nr:ABC transporter permease [Burkholderiaceae bacterium]
PPIRLAAALAIGGAALLAMPPIAGLPIPAYLAIAAWLFAGIACVPALTAWCGATLQALLGTRAWRMPPAWLALTQIAASPGAVSAALAGVVASFALASAMVFMVTSFRTSVDQWLDRVLPADLYARAPAALSGGFDAQTLHALQSLQGITRMQLARATELTLDPARPPVTLIARDLDAGAIQRQLPITGTVSQVPHGAVPLYVSEAMADGYGWVPGRRVDLPLPAAAQREQAFVVAAVWRDYARQHGAVVIDRADYRRLTGDQTISEAALWLDDGVRLDAVVEQALQRVPQLRDAELRSAADIRALSLRIFDRSFAVTYALEAMAILVALFGVAATFAGEALARAREFGMLRHFGFTRAQIARQVALEAAGSVAVAVAWGGALGTLIGLVLIRRVNPQSFHWTMDAVWPADLLLGSAAVLVASATLAAVIAARSATGDDPVRAVRQDW